MQVRTDTDGTHVDVHTHLEKEREELQKILDGMHPEDMRATKVRAKLKAVNDAING